VLCVHRCLCSQRYEARDGEEEGDAVPHHRVRGKRETRSLVGDGSLKFIHE
jgi:hypothetical protein